MQDKETHCRLTIIPEPITFVLLTSYHEKLLLQASASVQVIQNHRSALKTLIESLGLDSKSPVPIQLATETENFIGTHIKSIMLKNADSERNRKVILRKIALSYVGLLKGEEIPERFGDALRYLINRCGKTINSVWKAAKIDESAFYHWLGNRCMPSKAMIPTIHLLENILFVPRNTLLARCSVMYGDASGYKPGGTKYGRRIQELQAPHMQYRLKKFPDQLLAEWREMYAFFTDILPPEGINRTRRGRWRVKKDGTCATAGIHEDCLSAFFGFLALPITAENPKMRGLGMDPSKFSLTYLCNLDLIKAYLEFRKSRSGVLTSEMKNFLGHVTTYLRPGSGFLWYKAEWRNRSLSSIGMDTPEAWQNVCKKSRDYLIRYHNALSEQGHIIKGRDGEPIKRILNEQHPIHVLHKISELATKAFRGYLVSPSRRAAFCRDILTHRLLSSNPLRISHFCNMTYKPDNTGNLYQTSNKSWRLRFEKENFKNEDGAANTDYDVNVNKSLWPFIEEYLKEHRPHLFNADKCDYIFLPSRSPMHDRKNNEDDYRMSPCNFQKALTKLTYRFSPVPTSGFANHYYRHIVATDILKNNPGKWHLAAAALHDREETVRKAYAHLTVSDNFRYFDDYLTQTMEEAE